MTTVMDPPVAVVTDPDPQKVAFAQRLAVQRYVEWFRDLPRAAQEIYAAGEELPYVGPALTGVRIGAGWLWRRVQGLARALGRGGLLALVGLTISTDDGQRAIATAADWITKPFRWTVTKVLNGLDRLLGWLHLTGAQQSLRSARAATNERIRAAGTRMYLWAAPYLNTSSRPMQVTRAASAGYLIAKAVSFIPGPIGTVGQVVVLGFTAYRIITRMFRGTATAEALSQVPGAVRSDVAGAMHEAAEQVVDGTAPRMNREQRRTQGQHKVPGVVPAPATS